MQPNLFFSFTSRDLFPIEASFPFLNSSQLNYGRGRLPFAAPSLCTPSPCRRTPPPHHPLVVWIYSVLRASPSPYVARVGLQCAIRFPLAICRSHRSAALCLPPPRHTLATRSLARFAPHPRRTSAAPVSSALPALPLGRNGPPCRSTPLWRADRLHCAILPS
ncbi:hypothetical protein BDA96_10G101400 [Sorghum bicolor]|uniref:Uncharacterized protein n=1 Tax=Sorghum bicolor TaxID=4558 RepID=A0A921Q3C0_SORBI|nr:hypothetical protein BDA96_10G101400 [Sorghum bicolor]